jgi:hypothetical protein
MHDKPPDIPYANAQSPLGPYDNARPRVSGAAVTSLVCGLLFCIPMITSLVAVVFGAVGIRQTKNPHVGGRGLAIAGLILGILGVGGWILAGVGGVAFWSSSSQVVAVAEKFTADMAAGDLNSASASSLPNITMAQLTNTRDQYLKPLGTLQQFSIPNRVWRSVNGKGEWTLSGNAIFANGAVVPVNFALRPDATGNYKIFSGYYTTQPVATQPTAETSADEEK